MEKELELYLHIPFCERKCAYCDFLSYPMEEQGRSAYTGALIHEIRSRKEVFADYRVSTVFVGGGTPSILDGEDTARIFAALKESFKIDDGAEITMEVNPGTVTREKLKVWKAAGINRLSIGLQSADDRELALLGRIHTYAEFEQTWHDARRAGFENINVDLISAIPAQTAASWERTLTTAADLGPEHISAYSLIIEEGTPFYEIYGGEGQNTGIAGRNADTAGERKGGTAGRTDGGSDRGRYLPLPDEDEERLIYKRTAEILRDYGYHRYEISNYAREGYECRHNLGYWERKEYLGLGLGASSLIRETRFHNTSDMKKYMEVFGDGKTKEGERIRRQNTEPRSTNAGIRFLGRLREQQDPEVIEDVEELTEKERIEEFMFLGLRETAGISRRRFLNCFGKSIEEVYGSKIAKLKKDGLLEEEKGRIRLTERGIDISNYVFCEFMF